MSADNRDWFNGKYIHLLILGVILTTAFWLRIHDLSDPSFDTDEYLHVLSAREMLHGNDALLPSGHLYERAKTFTWIVAGSFQLFGVSELSARLPGVFFGTLMVLAAYLIGRRWFGVWEGLAAAALVACFSDLVLASRLCRMYTLFHLFYLGMIFAYYRACETRETSMRRKVLWFGTLLCLGYASYSMHFLTLDFLPALLAFWIGLALLRVRSRYSLYVPAALAVLGGAIVVGILDPAESLERLRHAPPWAEPYRHYETFYVDRWGEQLPWIWWAVLPAIPYLCLRFRGQGVYVVCQFAVPFLLHSLLFGLKSPRYVTHLYPLLALMVSPFLIWGLKWIAYWTRRSVESYSKRLSGKVPGVIIASALVVLSLQPSLVQSSRLEEERNRARWREVLTALARKVQPDDALVAALPLSVLYYMDRPATHALNHPPVAWGQNKNAIEDVCCQDWYSGLPVVTSKEELCEVVEAFPRGWVVMSRYQAFAPGVLPAMLQESLPDYLDHHPTVDSSVIIYRWSSCP